MILWQGFGFLAVLVPILAYLIVVKLMELAMGVAYTNTHSWPGALGTLIGAIGVAWLAKAFDKPKRLLMDVGTGQPVVMKPKHTLFFIPLLYVAVILAIVAVGMLVFKSGSPL
jgi:hypothetical protein